MEEKGARGIESFGELFKYLQKICWKLARTCHLFYWVLAMINQQDQNELKNIETLFHDLVTPLVISKMKAELLVEHLPAIMTAVMENPELRARVAGDPKLVDALGKAPEILLANIQLVQKKLNLLSTAVVHQAGTYTVEEGRADIGSQGAARAVPIKTVLLVDDEVIHRDIAKSLLCPQYDVDFACNGLEALSLCEKRRYDLILMDLHMPKMNGEQATIALRDIVSDETIIVGLTSLPIGVNRSGLLAMGFNDFLEKPLTLKSLQKLLRSHSINA